MACNTNEACAEDCTLACKNGDGLLDIEDYKVKVKSLEEQNLSMKQLLKELGHDAPSQENGSSPKRKFRSSGWFGSSIDSGLASLYVDRYLNYGLTQEELMSGKPIIGIAQSGSDIAPCNRHHLETAKRVKAGIMQAGGIPLEFPTHPIQESSRRPTATLDRNLAYLSLVEVLHAYPLDGVVLLTGCDKTTPACLMAASTVVSNAMKNFSPGADLLQNIPAICLNVGPMLNGRQKDQLIGSGTVLWKARELRAEGLVDDQQFFDMVTAG